MFKKSILILAASCMMYSCTTQTESNPFLTDSRTNMVYRLSTRSNWNTTNLPSMKGIEEQNTNIDAIVNNPEAPTFENVIVAFDNSSPILDASVPSSII